MDREQVRAALAEAGNAPCDPPSLTDAAPPGAFTLAGRPARVFAAADYRILQIVHATATVDDPVSDSEAAQIMLYCAIHASRDDVRKLWREARDPSGLRERVFAWAASVPASEYAQMERDATPILAEFGKLQKLAAGADDLGNASPADQTQTGSP